MNKSTTLHVSNQSGQYRGALIKQFVGDEGMLLEIQDGKLEKIDELGGVMVGENQSKRSNSIMIAIMGGESSFVHVFVVKDGESIRSVFLDFVDENGGKLGNVLA